MAPTMVITDMEEVFAHFPLYGKTCHFVVCKLWLFSHVGLQQTLE